MVRPIVQLVFKPTLHGVEHLPTDRPYLLVANHSGGLGLAELTSFAVLVVDQIGVEHRIAGFAHPIGFRFKAMRELHALLGSVPSTYEAAYAAIESGASLLVFPGGDHEAFRPIWLANTVDFGGRKGFLRIAQTAGIPIVPMGIRGSHITDCVPFPLACDADGIAKAVGSEALVNYTAWHHRFSWTMAACCAAGRAPCAHLDVVGLTAHLLANSALQDPIYHRTTT